jgi:DNA (cytosine-5)-methyltransferase 1
MLDRLRGLGYTVYYKVLNSLDFGVPQKRERIYIAGFLEKIDFLFPAALGYYKPLKEILEDDGDVPGEYFLSPEIRRKRLSAVKGDPPRPSIWHENIGGHISALPYSCALRAGGSYNYLVVNGERRLTAREMLRLQGFPDTFKIPIPYSQARKVAGNSVTVPVIQAIAKNMISALQEKKPFKKEKFLEEKKFLKKEKREKNLFEELNDEP